MNRTITILVGIMAGFILSGCASLGIIRTKLPPDENAKYITEKISLEIPDIHMDILRIIGGRDLFFGCSDERFIKKYKEKMNECWLRAQELGNMVKESEKGYELIIAPNTEIGIITQNSYKDCILGYSDLRYVFGYGWKTEEEADIKYREFLTYALFNGSPVNFCDCKAASSWVKKKKLILNRYVFLYFSEKTDGRLELVNWLVTTHNPLQRVKIPKTLTVIREWEYNGKIFKITNDNRLISTPINSNSER